MPNNNLSTRGRTTKSYEIGSNMAGGAASSRIFNWILRNPDLVGGNYNYRGNLDGSYGGGGGGGSPGQKSSPTNGGNGGDGIVILYANADSTNNTTNFSGISSEYDIPTPTTSIATFNLINPKGNVALPNSSFTNNKRGYSTTGVTFDGTDFYTIILGPGTYTVETNICTLYYSMAAGGGGGGGGPFVPTSGYNYGAGGGGGGGVSSGTIYLYSTSNQNTNYGCTSTIQITVGSGGTGGGTGNKSKNPGGIGANGQPTSISITGPQLSTPIEITCSQGIGGISTQGTYLTSGQYPFYYNLGTGGVGGTVSTNGFNNSVNMINGLLFNFSGGNGGNGSNAAISKVSLNSYTTLNKGAQNGNATTGGSQQAFNVPYFNGNSGTATIGLGGGGGGSNAYFHDYSSTSGGAGGGGVGGSLTNGNPGAVALSIWDIFYGKVASNVTLSIYYAQIFSYILL